MRQIVCLATSPWYPIPTRKQQVMSRIPDAEILYFDPSVSVIAPTLSTVMYSCFFKMPIARLTEGFE